MRRFALGVEYDGRGFHGWETQRTGPTVQATLEGALGAIAGHRVTTVCAGRTDAGVHALSQVVHFDSEAQRPRKAWVQGTNTHLPDGVAVTWCHRVPPDFHARFSALARHYRYVLLSRPVRSALLIGRAGWTYRPLEVARMRDAAGYLLGEHDFSAYRASGCQARSPRRTIRRLEVAREGRLIRIDVRANAFLQHMVRNIVGVLVAIGSGERPVEWAREVLDSRDRRQGGVTASPDGLYLVGVEYPAALELPSVPSEIAV